MPQIPDQIRPAFAAIAKYHFWILGLLVPIVLIPLLFRGRGTLDTLISAQRSKIEGQVSALNAIKGQPDHPNESLSEVIEKSTGDIQSETMAEWSALWNEQQGLRVWPKTLGDDFVTAVSQLKPGRPLERSLLLRYQNNVASLVRELPARMGATELMTDAAAAAAGAGGPPGFAEGAGRGGPMRPGGDYGPGGPGFPGGPSGSPRPFVAGTTPTAEWSADDQRRVLAAFIWEKPPSTTQVLLAQEELWVYGALCDVIRTINASAAEPFNPPIPFVDHIAVGYPAAEDQPGGQGASRILGGSMTPLGAPGEGMPGEGGALGMLGGGEMGATGPAVRPPHPRFGSGVGGMVASGPAPSPEAGGDPAAAVSPASPDDMLREWIYVDFTGRPLTSAELATSADARLMHLVPFTLRVTMDQRRIDALLTDLATNPIPIDVRQVRINPGSVGMGTRGVPGPASPESAPERPFDVLVELRGTVGLATPPDEAAIAGADLAAGVPGA